jgi:stage IV sporulation protein B
MKLLKPHKKKYIFFLSVFVVILLLAYIKIIITIPGEITLFEDDEYVYSFNNPFLVKMKVDRDGIIKLSTGELKASNSYLQLSNPISVKGQKNGSVNISMKLFGLISLKTLKVDVVSNKELIACGNTVGVKLEIDGILVIGVSDVETGDNKRECPAAEAGIKPGDYLVEANGVELTCIDDLITEIDKSKGNLIKLKYRRGTVLQEVKVTPVKAVDDKKYHIGLWVRDSTAGIGTLTFYDPKTNHFGALGHGITDIDTGMLMPVKKGEILESKILGVKTGRDGFPGELKGVFNEGSKLGEVLFNSECGIYGVLNNDAVNKISQKKYQVGLRAQANEGPAKILSNIEDKSVEAYDIEILKISRQNISGSKGMVIKITDPRLLKATGGIVQGMSGSPILQNGKIIGAVTHVLINDPSKGYGIFIEGMIRKLNENIRLERAG